MTSTSLMETPDVSIASMVPPELLAGARKGVATSGQSLYKSIHCRIVHWLAWLGGKLSAFQRGIVRTKKLGLGDMAAQENTNAGDLPSIPDHQLVRRIGEGAFGDVWLAQSATGIYRAVKIVRRSRFESDGPFRREFEAIQLFDRVSRTHAGFVNLLHVGRNDGQWFFYIMELADDLEHQQQIDPKTYVSRTLSKEIKTRGRLPFAECLHAAIVLSDALVYLHREGLVHGDIKPSNIIYVNGRVRLADVGLVTNVRGPISGFGTPGYIPEEGPGTVLADIFALGCVIYQAFTGNPIDEFPALPTCLMDDPDWLKSNRLNQIILKARANSASDRYQTVEQLLDTLVELQRGRSHSSGPDRSTVPSVAPRAPGVHMRVTLLFKTGVEPDIHLMELLKQRLVARGIDVYVDRRLAVGKDWAREIENKIRGADAVVSLLSAASVQSEMLEYELDVARQAAQLQKGRPIHLAVRVRDVVPWPPTLPFLDAAQFFSWNSPADNETLVTELARALESEQRPEPATGPRLEPAGGAVALDSKFYVVRSTDELFQNAVTQWEGIVLIKGARQMGKTSLLARGLEQARHTGSRVALCDFQKLSLQDLKSAENFYLAIAGLLADQLELDVSPQSVWNPQRSANINFERFIRREVMGKVSGHLVWAMDEVDRLFACNFASEVFGLFRSWHNGRALDPTGPWSRLTLAIAYATEAHLFITDVNQSPFNVGIRADMDDFTLSEVMDLNERHGAPLQGAELPRFHQLLGGQPYLVRRGLHVLAEGSLDFDTFVAQADADDGIFGDHLRRILVMLVRDAKLTEVIRGMLHGQPCPDLESFYRLRSAGFLRGDSLEDARLRCEIYASYLKRHLK